MIVLDNGKIAEEGTPDELRTAGGIYNRIYDIQSGLGEAQTGAGKEAGHEND